MSKKAAAKKKAAKVVTVAEQRALEEQKSLRRSVKIQRRLKALSRVLDRAQHAAHIDLLDTVTLIAKQAGYKLEREHGEG